MTNGEIYRKTIGFSVRRLLFGLIGLAAIVGLAGAGFLFMEKRNDMGIFGLAVGLIVGIIIVAVAARFISYLYKAGQIAMMTHALTENELPDNVIAAGKKVVKQRFLTVAVYYAAVSGIKALFRLIGKGFESVGRSIGGDTGGTVGSVVSSVLNTIVAYLCDCCLGWVFFRRDQNAFKATCEGAVIFFKHGKTFARNMGRIFGLGALSFVAIGGAFTGVFYLVFSRFPDAIRAIAAEFAEMAASEHRKLYELLSNPTILTIAAALLVAVIIWSVIHSTFIRPFVLVGVLRNYLNSGMKDIPSEDSFRSIRGKSAKFDRLERKMG